VSVSSTIEIVRGLEEVEEVEAWRGGVSVIAARRVRVHTKVP
jgi:predicted Kef-type K+ transport protein